MDKVGYSLDDYLRMQKIIRLNAKENTAPQITLVTNCKLGKQILEYKQKNGGLDIFIEVFLCLQGKNPILAAQLKDRFS